MIWPWYKSSFENFIVLQFKQLSIEVKTMAQGIDALNEQVKILIADVTAEGDVVKAAAAAIKGLTDQQAILAQELKDAIAANDPAAIQAAADAISAQNDAIVAQTSALSAAIPATPAV